MTWAAIASNFPEVPILLYPVALGGVERARLGMNSLPPELSYGMISYGMVDDLVCLGHVLESGKNEG